MHVLTQICIVAMSFAKKCSCISVTVYALQTNAPPDSTRESGFFYKKQVSTPEKRAMIPSWLETTSVFIAPLVGDGDGEGDTPEDKVETAEDDPDADPVDELDPGLVGVWLVNDVDPLLVVSDAVFVEVVETVEAVVGAPDNVVGRETDEEATITGDDGADAPLPLNTTLVSGGKSICYNCIGKSEAEILSRGRT